MVPRVLAADEPGRAPICEARGMSGTASFSRCRTFRYTLTRDLGGPCPLVVIGLNPSTADATQDDPTVRREVAFARRWGFGRLVKLNAYAFRATDPRVMHAAAQRGDDIVGPRNDAAITRALADARATAGLVLVAWGRHARPERVARIVLLLAGTDARCLRTNLDGSPVHPLYQRATTRPTPWPPRTPPARRTARPG